jgi:hypothetical protein
MERLDSLLGVGCPLSGRAVRRMENSRRASPSTGSTASLGTTQ